MGSWATSNSTLFFAFSFKAHFLYFRINFGLFLFFLLAIDVLCDFLNSFFRDFWKLYPCSFGIITSIVLL